MQLLLQHPTPSSIRETLFTDPRRVQDPELLVLLLGRGSQLAGPANKPRQTWSAIELAYALLKAAGGHLGNLIQSVHDNELELKRYGLGETLGGRLIAATELAHRYCKGISRGGNPKIRPDTWKLRDEVFKREIRPTEGELIAILMAHDLPKAEPATSLLAAYPNPAKMVAQSLQATSSRYERTAPPSCATAPLASS